MISSIRFLLPAGAWLLLATGAAGDPPTVRLPPLATPDGRPLELNAAKGGVAVVVFLSPECPISNAYSPILNKLAAEFAGKPLRLAGVCVGADLSDADVAEHRREYKLKFALARDPRGLTAAKLGARVTPEAFVLDDQGRVRYHGRIDDLFAARLQRNANPKTHELRDAIAAVLAGRAVAVPHVEAVGCPIPAP